MKEKIQFKYHLERDGKRIAGRSSNSLPSIRIHFQEEKHWNVRGEKGEIVEDSLRIVNNKKVVINH